MSTSRPVPNRDDARPLLPSIDVVDQLDAAALVDLATQAAALHARAMARLATLGNSRSSKTADDVYMTVDAVAEVLKVTPEWVYRKAAEWSFAMKLAPKVLRIQRAGLLRWMAQRHRR